MTTRSFKHSGVLHPRGVLESSVDFQWQWMAPFLEVNNKVVHSGASRYSERWSRPSWLLISWHVPPAAKCHMYQLKGKVLIKWFDTCVGGGDPRLSYITHTQCESQTERERSIGERKTWLNTRDKITIYKIGRWYCILSIKKSFDESEYIIRQCSKRFTLWTLSGHCRQNLSWMLCSTELLYSSI